jgi:hypothetical protein
MFATRSPAEFGLQRRHWLWRASHTAKPTVPKQQVPHHRAEEPRSPPWVTHHRRVRLQNPTPLQAGCNRRKTRWITAGYRMVPNQIGAFRTALKRPKVTRRDRQPLVFMRALCPQNRLFPTALPQRRSEGQKQIKIEPVGGCGKGEAEAGRPGSYPTRFTLGLRDRALHAPSARSVAASVRTHQRPQSRHEAGYRKCQFTGCLRYACLAAGRQAHGFCPGRGARPTAGPTRLRFGHNGYPGGWLLCLR